MEIAVFYHIVLSQGEYCLNSSESSKVTLFLCCHTKDIMASKEQESTDNNTREENVPVESSQRKHSTAHKHDDSLNTAREARQTFDLPLTEVAILTEAAPPFSRGIPHLYRSSTNRVTSYQFFPEECCKHKNFGGQSMSLGRAKVSSTQPTEKDSSFEEKPFQFERTEHQQTKNEIGEELRPSDSSEGNDIF